MIPRNTPAEVPVVPVDAAASEADPRPHVALPSGGMPTWVLGLGAVSLGLVVMLTLNGQRVERVQLASTRHYASQAIPPLPPALVEGGDYALRVGAASASPFGVAPPAASAFAEPVWGERDVAPPRDIVPPAFAQPPVRASGSTEAPGGVSRFPSEPMPGAPMPGGGPASSNRPLATGGSAVIYDAGPNGAGGGLDDKGGDAGAARASLIRNRPGIVAQGEILPATLETPVSTARPGPIRAIVSRDVRGFDGARVLIPRGSRLIGEYRADPAPGRRRVLATWTRLIRPDGVAIRIDSPAADALGGTGMPGRVETHFLARFANAALQSALQIGVNLASRPNNSAVIIGNTAPITGAMGQAIIPGADEPPTVLVRPGAAISVFVARDLDFTGVPVVR